MIIKIREIGVGLTADEAIDALDNRIAIRCAQDYQPCSDMTITQRTHRGHWRWVATITVGKTRRD